MGESNFPDSDPRLRYIKMHGRKIYEYALRYVPQAMKICIEKAGLAIHDIKTIFLHQANEKLDDAILKALFKLYGLREVPKQMMPMNINKLGNSSVATVPTLFDMVRKGQIEHHSVNHGDIVLFASVGAGMNVNAVCYRI
jgi:3-oxoacyl-[acyl-carrier-protein] synthase-3